MKIQVLEVTAKNGLSKTSAKPYAFQICKAVVTQDNGVIEVGEIALFDLPIITTGLYVPVFAVKRSRDGKLEGSIVGLNPVQAAARAA